MPVEKLLEPIAAFLGPGAFGVLVASIALFRWWATRADKSAVDQQSARAALSADQAALFKLLREQVSDLRQQLDQEQDAHRETSRDRDRGWAFSRWWNRRAHAMRHAALNARQVADGLARRHGEPAPDWSAHISVILPDELEEPIPRPPAE